MCNFVREVSLRTRNFHTTTHKSPFKTIARLFASQHNSKCGKKDECEPKPKKCKKNLECPNFVMENCPPAHFRIGCKREYEEPECKKVNAPYKSYSELCAQRLPDDPSECMQCPWQRCGGVDDIKPPKRKYHTTTLAQTLNSSQAAPEFFYDCDAKKKPCRPPPPKCKKDPCQKEPCPEEKRRCPNPCGLGNTSYNRKKCSNWTAAFRLWSDKENILANKEWLDMQVMPIVEKMNKDQGMLCKKGKKKQRPDQGHPPPCPEKPVNPGETCKKEQPKLPYRKERDFKKSYYKRPDEPYSDFHDY
ncbi:unnamed protein product [Acanthoscelides obtectus]|uniref:Uncharacterized protein n=2 Tax=Acanthoscelides obtectus TaxID=200917 RepID=A0A9P0L318_ACAOB|nr:unnamed protein product [Acanthoscelides obtectus]CAK1649250.1 hypothetical protein AOBTE_LOCUS16110 [Acanthoscelides obtectus]